MFLNTQSVIKKGKAMDQYVTTEEQGMSLQLAAVNLVTLPEYKATPFHDRDKGQLYSFIQYMGVKAAAAGKIIGRLREKSIVQTDGKDNNLMKREGKKGEVNIWIAPPAVNVKPLLASLRAKDDMELSGAISALEAAIPSLNVVFNKLRATTPVPMEKIFLLPQEEKFNILDMIDDAEAILKRTGIKDRLSLGQMERLVKEGTGWDLTL